MNVHQIALLLYFFIPYITTSRPQNVNGAYYQPGDLFVGIYLRQTQVLVKKDLKNNLLCTRNQVNIHPNTGLSQGVRYIVDKINQERILPSNLTLGFMVISICLFTQGIDAINPSLPLLFRQSECIDSQGPKCDMTQKGTNIKHTIAIVSHGDTIISQTTSNLQTVAQVPVIAMSASSDIFSNKTKFPYFNRMIPSDSHEWKAILAIIDHFDWKYIHTLFKKGDYGEGALVDIKAGLLNRPNVCMASSFRMGNEWCHDEMASIVGNITSNIQNSRVVIAVLEEPHIEAIIKEIQTQNLSLPGQLIWILSDSANNLHNLSFLEGSLLIAPSPGFVPVPEFDAWFKNLTLDDASGDPWFPELFAKLCHCSLQSNTCNKSKPIGECTKLESSNISGLLFDGIIMATRAAGKVLSASPNCTNTTDTSSDRFKQCLNPRNILKEIRTMTFNNYTDVMKLDDYGDRKYLAQYSILQMTRRNETFYWKPVGMYHSHNDTIQLESNFSWPNGTTVQSFCTPPCGTKQGKQRREKCCWDCFDCEIYEYVEDDNCVFCPKYEWPNMTGQGCEPIPCTFDEFTGKMGILKTVASSLFITACLGMAIFIRRNQHVKVIKASSIQLSSIMLSGLLLGNIAVLLSMGESSDILCRVYTFLYCTSFTMLQGPLMVRTLTIYEIFFSKIKSVKRKNSNRHKKVMLNSLLLVLVTIIWNVYCQFTVDQWLHKNQPARKEHYVERVCSPPFKEVEYGFIFNILLVVISAVLAVFMRHLPENFNEAGFISLSACASLTLVVCFFPAYKTADNLLLQKHVLDLALIVNHAVNFFLLFVSKVPAVLDIEQRKSVELKRSRSRVKISTGGSQSHSARKQSSSVDHLNVRKKSAHVCHTPMASLKEEEKSPKDLSTPVDNLSMTERPEVFVGTVKPLTWLDSGVYVGPTEEELLVGSTTGSTKRYSTAEDTSHAVDVSTAVYHRSPTQDEVSDRQSLSSREDKLINLWKTASPSGSRTSTSSREDKLSERMKNVWKRLLPSGSRKSRSRTEDELSDRMASVSQRASPSPSTKGDNDMSPTQGFSKYLKRFSTAVDTFNIADDDLSETSTTNMTITMSMQD